MTNDDKALVERLEFIAGRLGEQGWGLYARHIRQAADRIEALSAENEQLRAELAKRGLEIKEKKDD